MKLRARHLHLLLIAGSLLLSACSENKGSGAAPTGTAAGASSAAATTGGGSADAAKEAAALYESTCVVCHGKTGAGDGPGAANLDPKPRAFGDAKWQAEAKDEDLKKAIVGGGVAVGKSPIMPGNPTLKDKPEVVDELVKIIRGFKK